MLLVSDFSLAPRLFPAHREPGYEASQTSSGGTEGEGSVRTTPYMSVCAGGHAALIASAGFLLLFFCVHTFLEWSQTGGREGLGHKTMWWQVFNSRKDSAVVSH